MNTDPKEPMSDLTEKSFGQIAYEEWNAIVNPSGGIPWDRVGMQVGWENIAQAVAGRAQHSRDAWKGTASDQAYQIGRLKREVEIMKEALIVAAGKFRYWAKAKENDGMISSAETLTYHAQSCEIASDAARYIEERERKTPPSIGEK